MPINWLTVGSLYGAAGVAFGAFGAHGLKSRGISDAKIASWGTASHYQIMHSVALIAVETAFPGSQKVWTKSLLVAGMTMFSGSIYMLVLDPQRFKVMGPITPLGGLALIGGWVALAVASRGRSAALR